MNYMSANEQREGEIWAKVISDVPDYMLDADACYRRIDNLLPICPICHHHPKAWIAERNDRGIVRCCSSSVTIVSMNTEEDPVSSASLASAWRRCTRHCAPHAEGGTK